MTQDVTALQMLEAEQAEAGFWPCTDTAVTAEDE
ncbi:ALQxL family class IV lanthipeptide [Streptomyces sp. NPDC037389]